jgi:hypothetical protein
MNKKTNNQNQYPHIFVISTMELDEDALQRGKYRSRHHRTPGFYHDLKMATEAVIGNFCDIQDCSYNYIVIEEIVDGIYPRPLSDHWFKWSRKEDKYKPCKKPDALANVFGFGIG